MSSFWQRALSHLIGSQVPRVKAIAFLDNSSKQSISKFQAASCPKSRAFLTLAL